MRRRWRWGVLAGTIVTLLAAAGESAEVKPAPSHEGPKLAAVTLMMGHRLYREFSDTQKVKLNQDFIVGDTEFSARVVQYVPDFTMDLKTHKITSRSNQPKNPAFKIIVKENKIVQDTCWAFLNLPPHFGRKSMIAFKVRRIDFTNAAALVADSTKAAKAAPPEAKKP